MRYLLTSALLVVAPLCHAQSILATQLLSTDENCLNTSHNIINIVDPTNYLNNNHQANAMVSYLGDPDTYERHYAISLTQTWGLEHVVGVPGASHVLGLYNEGLPVGSSGIAVSCHEAGFLINTYQFSHTTAVRGGGSGGSVSINPPRLTTPYSATDSTMRIEGLVKHPFHHWNEADASTQIYLYYYLQPKYCGSAPCPLSTQSNGVPTFAHVIALHESRTDGTYNEVLAHDTFVSFFSSPLADLQANGQPVQYLRPAPGSAQMANRYDTWADYRYYAADISYTTMQGMIAKVKVENPSLFASTSADPRDWSVVNVGAIVENTPAYRADCVKNANPLGCRNSSSAVAFSRVQALELKPAGPPCFVFDKSCRTAGAPDGFVQGAVTPMRPLHLDAARDAAASSSSGPRFDTLRARFQR